MREVSVTEVDHTPEASDGNLDLSQENLSPTNCQDLSVLSKFRKPGFIAAGIVLAAALVGRDEEAPYGVSVGMGVQRTASLVSSVTRPDESYAATPAISRTKETDSLSFVLDPKILSQNSLEEIRKMAETSKIDAQELNPFLRIPAVEMLDKLLAKEEDPKSGVLAALLRSVDLNHDGTVTEIEARTALSSIKDLGAVKGCGIPPKFELEEGHSFEPEVVHYLKENWSKLAGLGALAHLAKGWRIGFTPISSETIAIADTPSVEAPILAKRETAKTEE